MYKAILFSLDGDWVFDFPSDTPTEVWKKVSNMGSRWIFYPIVAVAKSRGLNFTSRDDRLVEGDDLLKGKAIKTASKIVADNFDYYRGLIELT